MKTSRNNAVPISKAVHSLGGECSSQALHLIAAQRDDPLVFFEICPRGVRVLQALVELCADPQRFESYLARWAIGEQLVEAHESICCVARE